MKLRRRPVIVALSVLVTLSGLLAAGAVSNPWGQAAPVESVAPPAQGAAALPESKPVAIDIPKIGAKSSLIELGLKPDRSLEVPSVEHPEQAGWYRDGAAPGEVGPAVIAGHVDGHGEEGVFYRLDDLKPGDVINVQREDGRTARFAVQRTVQVPKTNFPKEAVYGATPDPQLRLITCGGSFDSNTHHYRDNVIVFAALLP
jgi:LPXTG-site transpeptidase (sortase) family protein